MQSLLQTWYPVASDFGLVRAPLERVIAELQRWHGSIGIEYSRTEITSSLRDAFESLLPLAHSKMRRLFVATHSDWTVCFQNGIQGSDPFPAMSSLATQMGVLAMRVCSTPDTAVYPAVIWDVYAPEQLGGDPSSGCLRSICAVNDGRSWIFEEYGQPFPFEQVVRYGLRRKRDRFTREMLGAYLKEFGIILFSDDFLRVDKTSPAVRLQQCTKVWDSPEFSLEEVIGGAPWQHGKVRE